MDSSSCQSSGGSSSIKEKCRAESNIDRAKLREEIIKFKRNYEKFPTTDVKESVIDFRKVLSSFVQIKDFAHLENVKYGLHHNPYAFQAFVMNPDAVDLVGQIIKGDNYEMKLCGVELLANMGMNFDACFHIIKLYLPDLYKLIDSSDYTIRSSCFHGIANLLWGHVEICKYLESNNFEAILIRQLILDYSEVDEMDSLAGAYALRLYLMTHEERVGPFFIKSIGAIEQMKITVYDFDLESTIGNTRELTNEMWPFDALWCLYYASTQKDVCSTLISDEFFMMLIEIMNERCYCNLGYDPMILTPVIRILINCLAANNDETCRTIFNCRDPAFADPSHPKPKNGSRHFKMFIRACNALLLSRYFHLVKEMQRLIANFVNGSYAKSIEGQKAFEDWDVKGKLRRCLARSMISTHPQLKILTTRFTELKMEATTSET